MFKLKKLNENYNKKWYICIDNVAHKGFWKAPNNGIDKDIRNAHRYDTSLALSVANIEVGRRNPEEVTIMDADNNDIVMSLKEFIAKFKKNV